MSTTITDIETGLGAVVIGESTLAVDMEAGELTAVKTYYRAEIITLLRELQDANSKNDLEGRGNRELELKNSLDDRIK